jgi:hypothetical protein
MFRNNIPEKSYDGLLYPKIKASFLTQKYLILTAVKRLAHSMIKKLVRLKACTVV